MQVPVPQFIDVEDKIFGPFTLRQFAFIFIGGLLIAALFRIFHLSFVFFILALPIAVIFAGIAFGNFNGRHIYNTIPIFISFFTSPKVFVFHRERIQDEVSISRPVAKTRDAAAPVSTESPRSRLKQLSLLLDQKNQEEIENLKNL